MSEFVDIYYDGDDEGGRVFSVYDDNGQVVDGFGLQLSTIEGEPFIRLQLREIQAL